MCTDKNVKFAHNTFKDPSFILKHLNNKSSAKADQNVRQRVLDHEEQAFQLATSVAFLAMV